MQLSHAIPVAGHLGREKKLAQILAQFLWPRVYRDVADFCASCPQRQLPAPRPAERAPFILLPLISVPFEQIGVDIVSPLEKSAARYQFILVVVDYVSWYTEAVLLRSMNVKGMAMELMNIFTQVRVPREILTDQRTNFMSQTIK